MSEAAGLEGRSAPTARLILTLSGAGALAGIAIVAAFLWTAPRIEANRARALRAAIEEVLKQPDRYDTLYVVGGTLAARLPAGADPRRYEQVYLGYRGDARIGFAVTGAEPGFQDVVRLIFGYDPATRAVIGMRVLESKETPGLGDKIEKDSGFVSEFDRVAVPLVGVKRGQGRGDSAVVDMITGATISSRAVIRIINHRLERLEPLLDGYREARAP